MLNTSFPAKLTCFLAFQGNVQKKQSSLNASLPKGVTSVLRKGTLCPRVTNSTLKKLCAHLSRPLDQANSRFPADCRLKLLPCRDPLLRRADPQPHSTGWNQNSGSLDVGVALTECMAQPIPAFLCVYLPLPHSLLLLSDQRPKHAGSPGLWGRSILYLLKSWGDRPVALYLVGCWEESNTQYAASASQSTQKTPKR